MLIKLGTLLAGALVLLTVAMMFSRHHSLLELVSNFRLQLAVVTIVGLLALAIFGRWGEAGALASTLIVHSVFLAPLLFASPDPVPSAGETARIMQYNVLYGNNDYDAIARHVLESDADVVALHELTTNQWAAIEPMLDDEYPYSIGLPIELSLPGSRGSGKALLSRTPLARYSTDPIDVSSRFRHPPLAALTEVAGEETLVIALHPSPSRTDSFLIEQRKAKLGATADLTRSFDGPSIIISDLNVAPTSPIYSDFLKDLGWDDPRRKLGAEPTWPVGNWDLFSVAIDHIFVSPEIALHDYEVGHGGGSDHHSLVAVLSFT